MNYNLALKKGYHENLNKGQGHMTRLEKVMLHISRSLYRRPEHIYGVCIALDCLYQNLLPKKLLVTFHDLK